MNDFSSNEVNKDKKIVVIIFVLIVSIIFIGLFFLFEKLKNKDNLNTVDSSMVVVENIVDISDDLDLAIRENSRPEVLGKHEPISQDSCENMKNDENKKECLRKLNKFKYCNKGDLEACLKYSDDKNKSIKEVSYINKDETQCALITDHRIWELCISEIAKLKRNELICEIIPSSFEKKECKDRVLAFKIKDKALNAKNDKERAQIIKECEKVTMLEYGPLCHNQILSQIDYNCDIIEYGYAKDYCLSTKINYNDVNKSICDNIPLENYKKVCFKELENPKNYDYGINDSDNDGKSDSGELFYNIDPFNPDTDSDGLFDGDEILKYFSNPSLADTDGDGLNDFEEIKKGTMPNLADTDGDGINDKDDENPFSSGEDTDQDGLSDSLELVYKTDPNNPDTDGDGFRDGDEVNNVTNPLGEGSEHDTDGDGLIDVLEVVYGTSKLNTDTDGDGMSDKEEIDKLQNPLGEGYLDFDKDGLSNIKENEYGTSPSKKDTNDDGVDDFDSIKRNIDPVSDDVDGDGITNKGEIEKTKTDPFKADTDGDGLNDREEISIYKTDPNKADTDGDGYSDKVEIDGGFDPNK